MTDGKSLIEVDFPLEQVSLDLVHEKNVLHGHIATLHIWPARRRLAGLLSVADEYLAALTAKGEPTGKRTPFIERKGDKPHLRLEGQAHPNYYDLFLDHTLLSMPHYPPHDPHLVAARREFENWFFWARHGHGKVVQKLSDYMRDLAAGDG
jgi:hypothetical protein